MRDPKPEELGTPEFNAVWGVIKHWDIGTPQDITREGCQLYSSGTGNHVVAILDALKKSTTSPGEALVFAWAKACSLLDSGIDPREYEILKLLEEFKVALQKPTK